jgi:hypothetical protein
MQTMTVARLAATVSLVVPWFAGPFVVARTVERNARAGVYGIADAVVIPILGAWLLTLVGGLYLAVVLWLVIARLPRPAGTPSALGTRGALTALAVVIPPMLAIAAYLDYWSSGPHAPILVCYALPLIWLVWAFTVIRRPQVIQ